MAACGCALPDQACHQHELVLLCMLSGQQMCHARLYPACDGHITAKKPGWMQAGIGTVLYLLQINLIPFATAGGVGGIVLGFASQSVLANIVAGSNLLITR